MVRPWIDSVTRDKFQILGSDFLSTLRNYIDDDQIPAEYGGTHSSFVWQWPYPEESGCSPEQIVEYNSFRKMAMNKNKEQEP